MPGNATTFTSAIARFSKLVDICRGVGSGGPDVTDCSGGDRSRDSLRRECGDVARLSPGEETKGDVGAAAAGG